MRCTFSLCRTCCAHHVLRVAGGRACYLKEHRTSKEELECNLDTLPNTLSSTTEAFHTTPVEQFQILHPTSDMYSVVRQSSNTVNSSQYNVTPNTTTITVPVPAAVQTQDAHINEIETCAFLTLHNLQQFADVLISNGFDSLKALKLINERHLDTMQIVLPGKRTQLLHVCSLLTN